MFDAEPLDAVVIGAGFAGLYMVYRLREQGFSVHGFERGDGVGGTWYWNRYPGARCDSEIMFYSFSFLTDLEQEWPLTERYPGQPDILRYLEEVADRLDLRKDFTFGAEVTAVEFDEAANLWTLRTAQGHQATARYVVTAVGCLSTANQPRVPRRGHLRRPQPAHRELAARTGRLHRQAGRRHRHRRLGHPGDPGDRRAGGAPDGVPAHRAVHRSPPRTARSISSSWRCGSRTTRSGGAGRGTPPAGSPTPGSVTSALEVPEDERRATYEAAWGAGGLHVPVRHLPRPGAQDEEANKTAADFVRSKIDEIVRDPRGRGHAQAVDLPDRHQADAARHELLRDLQPAERHAGRPAAHPGRGDHPDGHQDQRRAARPGRHRLRHRVRRAHRAA